MSWGEDWDRLNQESPNPNLEALLRRLDHKDSTCTQEQINTILGILLDLPYEQREASIAGMLDYIEAVENANNN